MDTNCQNNHMERNREVNPLPVCRRVNWAFVGSVLVSTAAWAGIVYMGYRMALWLQ